MVEQLNIGASGEDIAALLGFVGQLVQGSNQAEQSKRDQLLRQAELLQRFDFEREMTEQKQEFQSGEAEKERQFRAGLAQQKQDRTGFSEGDKVSLRQMFVGKKLDPKTGKATGVETKYRDMYSFYQGDYAKLNQTHQQLFGSDFPLSKFEQFKAEQAVSGIDYANATPQDIRKIMVDIKQNPHLTTSVKKQAITTVIKAYNASAPLDQPRSLTLTEAEKGEDKPSMRDKFVAIAKDTPVFYGMKAKDIKEGLKGISNLLFGTDDLDQDIVNYLK